jgi:formate-dependent nitrite reductase membrane component NrfD
MIAPSVPDHVNDAAPLGYYGVPVIHGSHWKWLIIWYFFFGGISGASAVIAAVARLPGGEEAARLARSATYVSVVALLPCPPLLILDLGRPRRFLNMLRTFRPSSPMSLGSWGLTAFGAIVTLAAANQLSQDLRRRQGRRDRVIQHRLARSLAPPTALAGFFLAGYTGTLLAATAVPLWAKRPTLLGPLFLASAMASGASAVAAVQTIANADDEEMTARLHRLEAVATITEGALLTAWLVSLGPTNKPLMEGKLGGVVRHVIVGAGMTAPLALTAAAPRLPRRLRRVANLVAPILTLCGVFALRYTVVEGGRRSADDPQATFEMTQ